MEFKCQNSNCGYKEYFEITEPVMPDITGAIIPLNSRRIDHTLTCMKCGTETRVYGEVERISNWQHLVEQTIKLHKHYNFDTYKPDADLLSAIEEVESIVKEQKEGVE